MSFRHYTKLKEIAKKYGCDSSGCDSNGDLIDRLYETPITPVDPDQPVDPTGPIDAKIDIQNITARFVSPVEGHSYLGGVVEIPAGTKILELIDVVGDINFFPITQAFSISGFDFTPMCFFNDVENPTTGNIMLSPVDGFTNDRVEAIKNEVATNGSIVLSAKPSAAKFTITRIAE